MASASNTQASFADQGTLTGEVGVLNNPQLEGVRGQADGTVYRLPW